VKHIFKFNSKKPLILGNKNNRHLVKPLCMGILTILLIPVQTIALPVGDPRTPDPEALARMEIPVEQGVHELAVHAFMGASRINYPDVGGTRFSPGFGAGFSYSFFFDPKWSILIGGGIQLFNNRGTAVDSDFSSNESGPISTNDFADEESGGKDQVFLYYSFNGYQEKQWSLMLMIPIMFQYQSNEYRNKAFYYALGVKLGFPFAGGYEGKAARSRVCGYYPSYWPLTDEEKKNIDFKKCNSAYAGDGLGGDINNPPEGEEKNDPEYNKYREMGFGDFGEGVTSNSKLKLGSAFFAAMEAGVKWRLYNKLAVYTGFWLDWGLNNVAIAAVSKDPFTWDPYTRCPKGSNHDKCVEDNKNNKEPDAKINFRSRTNGRAFPMALGFTVRFALGGGSHHNELDSTKWINQIRELDSLLAICNARNAKYAEDSARAANAIAFLTDKADALLDSLLNCRNEFDREALRRQMDSLAREAELKRLADLERARLAALERARLDSIEHAKWLESQRAARLADFRAKLNSLMNGLDDYNITQTIPSEAAKTKLNIAAELMKDYPDLKLQIVGHTCDRGTHESNLRFGMQRAVSAKNYLVGKGISPSRLEISTKAETEPLFANTSEENRRKNRRVQIIILEGANIEQEVK